jgi:hypothetical protein
MSHDCSVCLAHARLDTPDGETRSWLVYQEQHATKRVKAESHQMPVSYEADFGEWTVVCEFYTLPDWIKCVRACVPPAFERA